MYAYVHRSSSSHWHPRSSRNMQARIRPPRQRRICVADLLHVQALPLVWPLVLFASVCCFSFLLAQTSHAATQAPLLSRNHAQHVRTASPVQPTVLLSSLALVTSQEATAFHHETLLSAHTSSQTSTLSSCPNGSRSYIVVAGDTLSTIAARFGTTWMALSSFNHLSDPNLIQVSQVLCIPGVSAHPIPAGPRPQPPSMVSGVSTGAAPYGPPPPLTAEERDLTQKLFVLINQDRAVRGLYPFEWNDVLAGGARLHAWNMYHCGFSHYCPDGRSPCQRITDEGISYTDCGENIAYAGPYPNAWAGVYKIQESMINEPPTGWHRIHLTSTTLHRIGIGVYVDPMGYIWFVEDMAS